MGSKFKDSSSNQELAGSFILDHLLHCRRWRRTRLRAATVGDSNEHWMLL
ncbi:hypothetical protein GQ55_9G045700 [Panicum hallii var. hallii]|uniref:Uncharacterized protein n=1 Tax=Panicum hallii var. hallii TaxID=1504633 RepID=A0A2T7BZW2_9POAL|nr:hypothetical protein GQ55_9G045700 [Panicum hallii var. hallii]